MKPRIKEYEWIVKRKWTPECMDELRRRSQRIQRAADEILAYTI